MMNKSILFLLVFIVFLILSDFAIAITIDLPNPLCLGRNPDDPRCINDFPRLITTITNYIFTLIASLAVLMFLWAGILFVTSAGNEGRLGNARKALWWAVVGTAIAIAGKGLVTVITTVIGNPP